MPLPPIREWQFKLQQQTDNLIPLPCSVALFKQPHKREAGGQMRSLINNRSGQERDLIGGTVSAKHGRRYPRAHTLLGAAIVYQRCRNNLAVHSMRQILHVGVHAKSTTVYICWHQG